MSFFGKAKCLVGVHDWSAWRYDLDGACKQHRVCGRDSSHKQERVEHNWSEYEYTSKDSCHQRRICTRCSAEEDQVVHERWNEWVYKEPDNCLQQRFCERCAEMEDRKAHVWDVWRYSSPTTCHQVRHCRRCLEGKQYKTATDLDHRWRGEVRINCREMRDQCERCLEPRSRLGTFHDFTPWQRRVRDGAAFRECQACGETEVR